MRQDADRILAGAATGGADLADLAGLAEEMYQRARMDQADTDNSDFGDRGAWLDITFRGAGRLNGDLTPGCAAALAAVLEALGRKAGPEDTRTAAQRRHDGLEEACRRLIASGMLPGRAGQQLRRTYISPCRSCGACLAPPRPRPPGAPPRPGGMAGCVMPRPAPPPATPPWRLS
jgi:hypothetical protein